MITCKRLWDISNGRADHPLIPKGYADQLALYIKCELDLDEIEDIEIPRLIARLRELSEKRAYVHAWIMSSSLPVSLLPEIYKRAPQYKEAGYDWSFIRDFPATIDALYEYLQGVFRGRLPNARQS